MIISKPYFHFYAPVVFYRMQSYDAFYYKNSEKNRRNFSWNHMCIKITILHKCFQPVVCSFTCWRTVKHTLWFWPSPAGRYMFLHMEWQCHKTIKKLTADPLFPILRLWFYSHYYIGHSFWLDSRAEALVVTRVVGAKGVGGIMPRPRFWEIS